jgi:hypothetical protein
VFTIYLFFCVALFDMLTGPAPKHGEESEEAPKENDENWWFKPLVAIIISGLVLILIGLATPSVFHPQLFVFALAVIIGYHVIFSVTPALHTPLMSVTNAISGIIVVGSMVQMNGKTRSLPLCHYVHSPSLTFVLCLLCARRRPKLSDCGALLVFNRIRLHQRLWWIFCDLSNAEALPPLG